VTRPAAITVGKSLSALCVLAVLLLWVAFEAGTESTWWIELARYLPYPVLLAPAALALLLSAWLSWRWRAAALACLGIVLVPVMDLQFNRGGSTGQAPLRLMTYNIKSYFADDSPDGFARIAWEIALHDPDVLVMQDARLTQSPADWPAPFRTVLQGRQVHVSGQYVIASRHPMQACRPGSIAFPGEAHHYITCTITAHGVEFDVATAHLLTPREGLNATRRDRLGGLGEWQHNFEMRSIQSRKLASDFAAQQRPLILAGDLNAPASSPVIAHLRAAGLRDAFAAGGTGYGYTYGHSLRTGFSFLRIDHVLVSSQIGVKEVVIGGAEASTHRPVIADLWLKPP